MRLADLKPGEEATISGMSDESAGGERLRELGLSDGTPIRVIKYAPLGDPMEIKVRGYYLSLRKNLARRIRVRRRHRGRPFEN
ncbi:MAG TPA: ferrous iron transport protein A [Caldithrix abyssi]|uniref:Ferrous iron transport protein A n=1 Tax=Caldithrix abyssi TaxID=187145 RepID=A0A7V5PPZ2_CALAY|nr:ferrous iron transport protein A [Caldithrix abyssi]